MSTRVVYVVDAAGGADTSGKGGIIDKFSAGRRRLKENIAQKTGKEGADNSEFAERAQRVTDLKEKVTRVSSLGCHKCCVLVLPVGGALFRSMPLKPLWSVRVDDVIAVAAA